MEEKEKKEEKKIEPPEKIYVAKDPSQ